LLFLPTALLVNAAAVSLKSVLSFDGFVAGRLNVPVEGANAPFQSLQI
jgi:hypothetical protein